MRLPKTKAVGSRRKRRGAIFVEYLLLVTIVGIGVIAGLATLRNALVNELHDLAHAVEALHCDDDPPGNPSPHGNDHGNGNGHSNGNGNDHDNGHDDD